MNEQTVAQQKAELIETFKAVMKQWDTQEQNPNADMAQLKFLQIRIKGLEMELDRLNAIEKKGKVA
jgi:hypothetical protein